MSALKMLGQMLYGERWLDRMSTELSVNERTIRRWSNGSQPMPRSVLDEIDELISSHVIEIVAARSKVVAEQVALETDGTIRVDH